MWKAAIVAFISVYTLAPINQSKSREVAQQCVQKVIRKRKRELVLSIFTAMVHQGYQHQVPIGIR